MFSRYKKIIDLRPQLSPIENQLKTNSCTANSIATAIEMKYSGVDVSRLFMYYNGRKLSNLQNSDGGAYIRDVLKSTNKLGTCTEEIWPFDPLKVNNEPNKEAYTKTNYRIMGYQRLSDDPGRKSKEIYHALERNRIVVFGMALFDSTFRCQNEVYELPSVKETIRGYHAVCLVGYDKSQKMFLMRNSWGTLWGKDGYTWLKKDFVLDKNFCDDFWVVM